MQNPHYSAQDRADTLAYLLSSLEKEPRVVGIVIVGSGATGFNDAFSDIDLVVVTQHPHEVKPAFLEWGHQIQKSLSVNFTRELQSDPFTHLWILLLSNYLELNISFWCLEHLKALKNQWRIHLDLTGQIEDILIASWKARESPNIEERYRARMASFWYYIVHAHVAIQRGKYWRAYFEIETIRNRTIELRGLRENLETERFRDVDRLPISFLNELAASRPAALNAEALLIGLKQTMACFFKEAEAYDAQVGLRLGYQLQRKIDAYFVAYE